jgi:hypothetical protein
MNKDLEILLDTCIDRMNEGNSLEDCLASYPEQAKELEPLLRAVWGFRDSASLIPKASAKSVMRRRLDAALVSSEKRLRKPQRRPLSLFGWSRVLASVAIALVLALIGFGLYGILTPEVAPPVVAQDNFRLLLSDDASEVTAIGEFASVNVTITRIGFQKGGESGKWIKVGPENGFPGWSGDLKPLIGTNATVIWNGNIEPDDYTKAFIYVDNVAGTLTPEAGGGQVNDIKIPSGKFQITKPFTVTADGVITDFVFDITIIKAGKSGQYLVKPQVGESGPDQEYIEVNHEDQDDSTREMKFRGTILTFPGDIWTVKIGDDVWNVNVTDAEIEGIPAEGRLAKIEGIIGENNTIVASEVEVKEPEEVKESKYEGTIVTFGQNTWTVDIEGVVRTVNVEAAKIEGTPDEGLKVEIEGTEGENNTIIASEVEVKEPEEEDTE